jgi:flagellar biosynthesis protein FlhF
MAEALKQVKQRLGPNAVILQTRTFKQGGVMGLGRQPMVEITAVSPGSGLPAVAKRSRMSTESGRSVVAAEGAARRMANAATSGMDAPSPNLLEEVSRLSGMVEDLLRRVRPHAAPHLPEPLAHVHLELVQRQVAQDIAERLVEQVRIELGSRAPADPTRIREHLARYVESMVPVAGPIRLTRTTGPTVIALVGSTGVGKTTTVAKLAANFSLREGRRVGMITIDSFRIAAVEQLRTYARIINVPLEVAMAPGELRAAVQRLRDRELILIDTAGRSQTDRAQLSALKGFLSEAKPHEVHLVLAGNCSQDVLLDTVERYRDLKPNRVIFTKLDEAIGFGAILTCLCQAEARLSYLTTGQNVPDDIEVARGRRVAELIVHANRLVRE